MIKVMVFGTFDILHPGHLFLFNEAKKLGDSLTVVVARDQTVQEVKHIQIQNNEAARLQNIINLDVADKVVLGNPGDKYEVIREEQPNVIALGYDQIAFTQYLPKLFPNTKIIHLESFKPEIYKSSKLRK